MSLCDEAKACEAIKLSFATLEKFSFILNREKICYLRICMASVYAFFIANKGIKLKLYSNMLDT